LASSAVIQGAVRQSACHPVVYRTGVAPVVIVDPRDAELKTFEGVGERWDEVVVSRGWIEVCQDGLDGTSVRKRERGGVH
jgi:hypothetical protein